MRLVEERLNLGTEGWSAYAIVLLALVQCEGFEVYARRHAVVQPAAVLEELLDDSGGCRAACDQQQVRLRRAPRVSEQLKRREELRARGVQPGHLVDEDNALAGGLVSRHRFQRQESFEPVKRLPPVARFGPS